MRTKPRPVDFVREPTDLLAATLASMGFSTAMIAARTGLTPSQINYRLKKARVKRSDYRNGQSPVAELVIKKTANPLKTWMIDRITEGVTK